MREREKREEDERWEMKEKYNMVSEREKKKRDIQENEMIRDERKGDNWETWTERGSEGDEIITKGRGGERRWEKR